MALNFRKMPRINRYIVGCKFKQKSRSGDSVWELIDT